MDRSTTGVASLVEEAYHGDQQALATLRPLVYDERRRLAARCLRREQSFDPQKGPPPRPFVIDAGLGQLNVALECGESVGVQIGRLCVCDRPHPLDEQAEH